MLKAMQRLQEQQKPATEDEDNFLFESMRKSYKDCQDRNDRLYSLWLLTLVLSVFIVLGGTVVLLVGIFLVSLVINPVTAGLITTLVGIPTGVTCLAISNERKQNDIRMEKYKKNLETMRQNRKYLELLSNTGDDTLKENFIRLYIASLNKEQSESTSARVKQPRKKLKQSASGNYEDGYTGNS
jgi:hypothetical protein